MAASMASQVLLRGLRRASTKFLLLEKSKLTRVNPIRWLNLQEYQSKKLMQDSGVAVQRFFVADTPADALEAAKRLNAKEIVLKAQILAGGRGKGVFDSGLKGGVHLTKDPAVVGDLASKMLGYNLTTKQTPKEGVKVKTVMVAEALDITRETYFAILMDRACNGPVMVGSPQGGMDIEEVAAKTPELIFKEVIDIFEGVQDDQAVRMAANLGFKGPLERQAADQIKRLYDLFLKVDATQVEVNPLGETPEGQVVCFDAKINFDDNAEFRQKDVFAMDDMTESDPTETEAAKYDLKYIGMDGNIACFVNGAGLAMATCDIIDLHGGKPANFLDLGGGVKESQVYQAFKLLTADPKVEAILVNIFGGIVNCAIIANGITKACRELELKVPLVVRLEGGYRGRASLRRRGRSAPPSGRAENAVGLAFARSRQAVSGYGLHVAFVLITMESGELDALPHSIRFLTSADISLSALSRRASGSQSRCLSLASRPERGVLRTAAWGTPHLRALMRCHGPGFGAPVPSHLVIRIIGRKQLTPLSWESPGNLDFISLQCIVCSAMR
ncbi:succinyl-CoA ligase [GDP-forming] subunit beta, mitochondrial [Anguilla rostrata]|uniref:succinyl-CoA ligase [GDP-forming] subunit beta, mitochondrial n=1 Tax=Anguilla rostrata TaxID=7938 RepID=UPI0030CC352C